MVSHEFSIYECGSLGNIISLTQNVGLQAADYTAIIMLKPYHTI